MKKTMSIVITGIIASILVICPTFAVENEFQEVENTQSQTKVNNQTNKNQTNEANLEKQTTMSNIQSTITEESSISNIDKVIDVEDPFNIEVDSEAVTADKINTWVNFKASQLVSIIQTVGKWVAFIVFVISGIKTVVGVFGKGDNISKGVVAMIISAVCFVAIEYADIIFQFLLQFIVK